MQIWSNVLANDQKAIYRSPYTRFYQFISSILRSQITVYSKAAFSINKFNQLGIIPIEQLKNPHIRLNYDSTEHELNNYIKMSVSLNPSFMNFKSDKTLFDMVSKN